MMWGCIRGQGVWPLVRVEGRMNGRDYIQLLSRHLLPHVQSLGPGFIYIFLYLYFYQKTKVFRHCSKLLAGTVYVTSSLIFYDE